MTFIVAIQAKDSIVVVSDTSSFYLADDGHIILHLHEQLSKLRDSHKNGVPLMALVNYQT